MKHLLFFSLPLLLIFISCSNDNLIDPIANTDSELKERIIGTWSNEYGTYKFYIDGHFQETIDIDYTLGDTTAKQMEILTGTYEIKGGILSKSITEWNIINNSFMGGGFFSPTSKIIIAKSLLYSYPVEICTRIGNDSDSLWGEWYTFHWTHHYSDPELFGMREQTYNFSRDSMMVTIGHSSTLDSTGVIYYETKQLSYNPPELIWDENLTFVTEFHNGQLWLFYKLNQPLTPLKKQN
jgi:hypothetical protein